MSCCPPPINFDLVANNSANVTKKIDTANSENDLCKNIEGCLLVGKEED